MLLRGAFILSIFDQTMIIHLLFPSNVKPSSMSHNNANANDGPQKKKKLKISTCNNLLDAKIIIRLRTTLTDSLFFSVGHN